MRLRGSAVRWRALVTLVVATLIWLLTGCSGPPAPAALPLPPPAATGLGLEISVPQPDFGPGDEIPLTFTVTNRTTSACDLAATDVGTVALTTVSRDGETLVPTVSVVRFFTGADEVAGAARRIVEPGGRMSFPVSAAVGQDGPGLPLAAMTPLATGEALAAGVPVDSDGEYAVSAIYAPSGQSVAQPCAVASNVAAVTFRVGSSPWWRWLLPVLIGLAVVLIGVVLFLVLRRRRGSSAGAVLLVIATTAALLIVTEHPANAALRIGPAADPSFAPAASVCMERFAEVGGDPAGLLPLINSPDSPVIRIVPAENVNRQRFSSARDGRPATIFWSSFDTLEVDPKTPTEPAVRSEPCEALYHELSHAFHELRDDVDPSICGKSGLQVEEVRAVFNENLYRASRTPPLPRRKTYHGKVVPTSLDECFPPPPPGPPDKGNPRIGPCKGLDGQSCANSDGDPHLVTFDRYRYDFQAVGEFVASKSVSGDLEIQTRQSAYPGSRLVSVNTAVAAKVGQQRLGFYLDAAGTIVVHRDGQVVDLPRGDTVLTGGGILTREQAVGLAADSYTLRWPDGSVAWLDPIGAYGIRLFAALATARRDQVSGLLGDFDGDRTNDLTGRDGAVVPVQGGPPFDRVYRGFGDSWRVSGPDSLFDYAAGQSTETFTDRTFPDEEATLDTLSAQARAGALLACVMAQVTDQEILDGCTLDVALTGQPAFALNAADTQASTDVAVIEPPPPSGGGTTSTTTSTRIAIGDRIGPDTPFAGSGRLLQNHLQSYEFIAEAGQVLVLAEPTGPCTIFAEVRFVDADERVIGPSSPLCRQAPSFTIPADGAYAVVVTGDPGEYGFVLRSP